MVCAGEAACRPAVKCYRRRQMTTTDDDRRQTAKQYCPFNTMCRRASKETNQYDKTHVAKGRLDFVDIAEFLVHAVFTCCSDFDVITEDNRVCRQTFSFQRLTIGSFSRDDYKVYSRGSSILSDEFMCPSRYQYKSSLSSLSNTWKPAGA